MMDASKVHHYIWQGLRKEVCADRINFYIPFCFGTDHDEPLCLTWGSDGILSDGGRTISELKKRVGDIQPYLPTINRILSNCGFYRLVGGQIMICDHYQTVVSGQKAYPDYLIGMNRMLQAMTLITNLDTISITANCEVLI